MTTSSPLGLADALFHLARHRDPQAWALVLELAGTDCWRCCLAVCGNAAAAEDAFQETLLQVRDNARLFKVRGDDADGDARRWLKRVASTTALQFCRTRGRAQRRDQRAGAQMATSMMSDPATHLHAADDLAALRETLAGLDEPRRTAITLHHLQGLPLAEVATELGRPVGTVKTWIHRGMEELHTLLASRGVTVSATSLVALFAGAQAGAATAAMPATVAASSATLLTTTTTAGVNAVALTTAGALPMAIKAGLLIVVTASAVTLPFAVGQEHRPDAAAPRAVTPTPRSAPVEVAALPAATRVQEASPAPAQEEAWQVAIRAKLQQRVTINFVDHDLANVVSFLRQVSGINIIVAPDVIAGGAQKVTLQVKDMRLEDCLKWICAITQTHWTIDRQAVYLSKQPILGSIVLRMYDVANLLSPGAPGGVTGEVFTALIKRVVEPASWARNGADIQTRDTTLFVNQSPEVHKRLEDLLTQIRHPPAANQASPAMEPWRAAILAQLEHKVTVLFDGKDLVETMDFIQRITGVNVVIDPAVIAGNPPLVTLKVTDIPIKHVLDFIMRSTGLHYALRDEAIFVSAVPIAAGPLEMRVYHVADLRAFGQTGEMLGATIRKAVNPVSWQGGAGIEAVGPALIVIQSSEVHRNIADMLATLRQVTATAPVVEPWRAAILAQLEQKMTVNFDGVELIDAVAFLQRTSGVNIVLDPLLVQNNQPTVTLKVADMQLKYVLDFIMRSTNAQYVLRDEAIYITKAPAVK